MASKSTPEPEPEPEPVPDDQLESDEAQVEEHVVSGEELYDPVTGSTVGGPVEPFEPLSEPHRDHVLEPSSDDPGDTSAALPEPAKPDDA